MTGACIKIDRFFSEVVSGFFFFFFFNKRFINKERVPLLLFPYSRRNLSTNGRLVRSGERKEEGSGEILELELKGRFGSATA